MNILVTGCSGFVGTNLVPRLRKEGHAVFGIDRRPLPYKGIERFVHGDLRDPDVVAKGLDQAEMVIHLAAAKDDFGISDEEFFEENVGITSKLIDATQEAGVKKWIFYSSVAAMGANGASMEKPGVETDELQPLNAYGESKAEAETLFTELCERNADIEVIMLRPAIIFGPGNYPYTNMYRLIDSIRKGRFMMVGDGSTIKGTSYITNCVDSTLFLMDHLKPGCQTFVYVDKDKMTSAEIVNHVRVKLGKKPFKLYLPLGLARGSARLADVAAKTTGINIPITAARISQFCTPTNYSAEFIRKKGFAEGYSVRQGLDATVEWYLKTQGR